LKTLWQQENDQRDLNTKTSNGALITSGGITERNVFIIRMLILGFEGYLSMQSLFIRVITTELSIRHH